MKTVLIQHLGCSNSFKCQQQHLRLLEREEYASVQDFGNCLVPSAPAQANGLAVILLATETTVAATVIRGQKTCCCCRCCLFFLQPHWQTIAAQASAIVELQCKQQLGQ